MLNKMQGIDNNINELNPGEGGDEPSQAVDHEIAPEERSRSQRSEAHAAERQRVAQDMGGGHLHFAQEARPGARQSAG